MAETTAQLRQEIEQHRQNVSETVDQIERRVNPVKVARRSTSKIRRGLTDLKDRLMGNDEPTYSSHRYGKIGASGGDGAESIADKARHAIEDLEPAEYVRTQTRGNALAAGLVSLGAGVLVGSLIPQTDQERRAVSNVSPELQRATQQAASMGKEVIEEVKDSAGLAVTELKDEAGQAATEVGEQAKAAAEDIRDSATKSHRQSGGSGNPGR